VRVRADAWSGFDPVSISLEARSVQCAVIAGLSSAFKRLLPALSHELMNRNWEMLSSSTLTKCENPRRSVVSRRFIRQEEAKTMLFGRADKPSTWRTN
jgi:hypothetical protein